MSSRTRQPQELLRAALLAPGLSISEVTDSELERDRVLAQAIVAGSADQARAFYDEHVRRIYSLIHRFTGSPDLTQDLTQDVFIRAFERMWQYRGEVPIGAWVRSIALSVTFNALKVRKRRRLRDVDADESLPGPATAAPDALLAARLAAALEGLPERSRAVVLLHDAEGYTHEEIAATLAIAPGTSRATLSQARAALREILQPVVAGRLAR